MKLTPKQKRRRIKWVTTVLILLSWLVLYLLGSFAAWSWNPGNWDEFGRGLVFVIALIVTVLWIGAATDSLENVKHA